MKKELATAFALIVTPIADTATATPLYQDNTGYLNITVDSQASASAMASATAAVVLDVYQGNDGIAGVVTSEVSRWQGKPVTGQLEPIQVTPRMENGVASCMVSGSKTGITFLDLKDIPENATPLQVYRFVKEGDFQASEGLKYNAPYVQHDLFAGGEVKAKYQMGYGVTDKISPFFVIERGAGSVEVLPARVGEKSDNASDYMIVPVYQEGVSALEAALENGQKVIAFAASNGHLGVAEYDGNDIAAAVADCNDNYLQADNAAATVKPQQTAVVSYTFENVDLSSMSSEENVAAKTAVIGSQCLAEEFKKADILNDVALVRAVKVTGAVSPIVLGLKDLKTGNTVIADYASFDAEGNLTSLSQSMLDQSVKSCAGSVKIPGQPTYASGIAASLISTTTTTATVTTDTTTPITLWPSLPGDGGTVIIKDPVVTPEPVPLPGAGLLLLGGLGALGAAAKRRRQPKP